MFLNRLFTLKKKNHTFVVVLTKPKYTFSSLNSSEESFKKWFFIYLKCFFLSELSYCHNNLTFNQIQYLHVSNLKYGSLKYLYPHFFASSSPLSSSLLKQVLVKAVYTSLVIQPHSDFNIYHPV